MINNFPTTQDRFLGLLILTGILTFVCLNFIINFASFDFYASDLGVYLNWSYDLKSHREPQQLPGYPFLLFFFRELTFGSLDNIFIAQLIVISFWAILVISVREILLKIAPRLSKFGTVVFAFYPFFGISFASYPLVDIIAHALLALSIYFGLKKQISFFILCVIAGTFLHKAMWPTYLLFCTFLLYKKDISFRNLIVISVPLASYYLYLFLLQNREFEELGILRNLSTNFNLNDSEYIFQGLLETLKNDSFTIKFWKGICFLVVMIATLFLTLISFLKKDYFNLIFCLPILGIGLFINEFTSSAFLRHSKFILFPMCCFFAQSTALTRLLSNNYFLIATSIVLILSQFLFVLLRLI